MECYVPSLKPRTSQSSPSCFSHTFFFSSSSSGWCQNAKCLSLTKKTKYRCRAFFFFFIINRPEQLPAVIGECSEKKNLDGSKYSQSYCFIVTPLAHKSETRFELSYHLKTSSSHHFLYYLGRSVSSSFFSYLFQVYTLY